MANCKFDLNIPAAEALPGDLAEMPAPQVPGHIRIEVQFSHPGECWDVGALGLFFNRQWRTGKRDFFQHAVMSEAWMGMIYMLELFLRVCINIYIYIYIYIYIRNVVQLYICIHIHVYIYIYSQHFLYIHSKVASALWYLRTILLLLVTTAFEGCWVLEQPNGSSFRYFPAFREFMLAMLKACGSSAAQPWVDKFTKNLCIYKSWYQRLREIWKRHLFIGTS